MIRIGDLPGLDDGPLTDIQNIKQMVERVKQTTEFVNLFAIVLHGGNPRIPNSTKGTLKCFREIFG